MPWITPLVLSFGAGYVDTASFLYFSGLLASHITGNLVLFAVAASQEFDHLDQLKLLSIPVFIVAVILIAWLHDRLPGSWGARRSVCLLGFVSLSLIALGLIGPQVDHGSLLHVALGLVLIGTMGVQNAVHRIYPGFGPMSTVMTGNIAQLTVNLARRLAGQPVSSTPTPAPWTSLRETLWLVGSFVAGCAAAIPMTDRFGMAALAVPGLVLGVRLLAASPRLAAGQLP